MNPVLYPAAVSTSRPSAGWLLVLMLAFWGAQMHGVAHGVSHLGRANAAPHAALCAECLAASSAGAAPTPAPGAAILLAARPAPSGERIPTLLAAGGLNAYRSRAPPLTT